MFTQEQLRWPLVSQLVIALNCHEIKAGILNIHTRIFSTLSAIADVCIDSFN